MNLISDFPRDPASEATAHPWSKRHEKLIRAVRRRKWFVLLVVVPVLLAMLYYGLIASDQYVSQSSFVIKAPGQKGAQTTTLANLIQSTGLSGGQDETDEVVGYIRSRSALKDASKQLDVRGIYHNATADRLARYPFPGKSDKFDNLFKYYQTMVDVTQDHETGLVKLDVKAFTPNDAQRLNLTLLNLGEQLVNKLNNRAQTQAINEAQRRVRHAEDRVRKARIQLAIFRNTQDIIDPGKQAGGIIDIVSKLTIERAQLQSQLDVMRRTAPNHPALPSLRARVAAMDAAIGGQTGRIVGSGAAIASKMGTYESLMVEQEFATQTLNVANASMEQARAEAVKQHFYLQRIVEPNTPDVADYPKRLKRILVIFGTTVCLYFIGWMLVVGILEHSPED